MARNPAKGVEDIRADIASSDHVRAIVDRVQPDAIINFAAERHVDRFIEADFCFWKSNVFDTRNLVLEACRMGIRMVQRSFFTVCDHSRPVLASYCADDQESWLACYHAKECISLKTTFSYRSIIGKHNS